MWKLLLIGVGGGVGSIFRYSIAGWGQRLTTGSFPIGTMLVNISGCLLIGFLTAALSEKFLIKYEYRNAILVGLLGGYTTFSTFGWETFKLLNDSQFLRAFANVVASCGLGVWAVWLGYRLAVSWLRI